jgi:hypothetical protein
MGSIISQTKEDPLPVLWIRIGTTKYCPGSLITIGRFEYQSKTIDECKELIKNYGKYAGDRLTMEYIFMYSLAVILMLRNDATKCFLRNEIPFEESSELQEIWVDSGERVVYYNNGKRQTIPWCRSVAGLGHLGAEFHRDEIPALIAGMLEDNDGNIIYMVIAILAWIYVRTENDHINLALE